MAAKILIVEDEQTLSEVLAYNFEADGFEVCTAMTGEDAELLAREQEFDLIILDWMLPGVSGIELCRRMRAQPHTQALPILMLTARGEEGDRIRGLATGADDYVVKPFSLPELMARARSILRRSAPKKMSDTLSNAGVVLDRAAHQVMRGARKVRLGPTEFRLLEYMMERAGRVLTRAQVLDGVWGRAVYVDERTVDVHIGRLRKALVHGNEGDPIQTVRGVGYVFGVDVDTDV